MPLRDDDIDHSIGDPRPKGKIPYLPDRNASLPTLRRWLSVAIGLPPEIRVDSVHRYGKDEDDSLVIILSNGMRLRCMKQKRLTQSGSLQAFFASESEGICQPHYLSRAEAGDVYVALCRLGSADSASNEVDDLGDRLAQFKLQCEPVFMSLARNRHDTIEFLRSRMQYDPKSGNGVAPVIVIDRFALTWHIRSSEWVQYLRIVAGQVVDERRLGGLMKELDCVKESLQAWDHDRAHKAHLVFYRLPAHD